MLFIISWICASFTFQTMSFYDTACQPPFRQLTGNVQQQVGQGQRCIILFIKQFGASSGTLTVALASHKKDFKVQVEFKQEILNPWSHIRTHTLFPMAASEHLTQWWW